MSKIKQVTPSAFYQHTLRDSFSCIGRGLHSGLKVIMRVLPAPANTGYRFIRRDVKGDCNEILAAWYTVSDTHLCTTISNLCGVRVSTIEHLIAALHVCDIDNAIIVLDGPEVPIMDGSAKAFVELIDSVGLQQQAWQRRAIVVKKPLSVREGDKLACLLPYDKPWVKVEIDFEDPCIGRQSISTAIDYATVKRDIACARTFGFGEHINALKDLGFARGGSLENAILVNNGKVVNSSGLRYDNEFVRHKVLDTIGDLALSGAPIIGYFNGKYTGHALNNLLLRKLMASGANYDFCNFSDLGYFSRKLLAESRA
ncbi:UDP-3-O-acyl-N-acetylglucosamine deacetylase [Marinagarivorans cellulosilyticus]|uniref:UDP-3-O-acyl-N-acetylglucosamine deacetylase n=1 Tax=Marinagarivorans cellulosilyticus TaxID=2721545 RepID=A0AAN1WHU1_9GAMM|nr:UDP-3-O-acyl-N-acetylglucosamine deacetylase [Marinagarivorans cellulosilyticus]BCD97869.1 UDP-3-O-[3-hydroxymyristoyl] N-acetylglucosamine deacetylase [Marinagarivorans cellulosilyticus]